MGRYEGCHMKHRAIKILETTLKWEMSFLPSFKSFFLALRMSWPKKFFCQKDQKFFLTWTLPLGRVGPTAALLENEMCFFCGQSPLFFNVLNIGNKNHKIPLCHIWSHLTSWGPSWNGAACWKHFVKLIMIQLKRKMTIMMRTRIILTKKIAVKKFSDKHKFIPNTHFFPRRSLLKIRLQWR